MKRLFLTTCFLNLATALPLAAQEITDLGDQSSFGQQLTQMVLSLAFILCLMFIGAWVVKRLLNQRMIQLNTDSAIKVLERRALSPKSSVYLIEVHGKKLLVGDSGESLSYLTDLPDRFDTVYQEHAAETRNPQ